MPSLTTGKIYKQQGLLISGSKTNGANSFTGVHWTSVFSTHDCRGRLTVVQTWPSLPGVYNTVGKTTPVRTTENKVLRSTWIIALQYCIGLLPYINMNQLKVYIRPLPPETPIHLPPHPTPLGCRSTPGIIPELNIKNNRLMKIWGKIIIS